MTIPRIDVADLVHPTFLGCRVGGGCSRPFAEYLARTEALLRRRHAESHTLLAFDRWHGVYSVGGYRGGAGYHGAGVAIDINYTTNGYAVCARGAKLGGESAANAMPETRAAFLAAAQRACAKVGVACDLDWRRTGERTADVYARWRAVSDAIAAYFAPYYDREPRYVYRDKPRPVLAGVTVPAEIAADFDAIRIPLVVGMPARDPKQTRNPARGLLDIPANVFIALREEGGVRLGLCDLGSESGDIMHVDVPRLAGK